MLTPTLPLRQKLWTLAKDAQFTVRRIFLGGLVDDFDLVSGYDFSVEGVRARVPVIVTLLTKSSTSGVHNSVSRNTLPAPFLLPTNLAAI